ncbi:MAG: hypothetical protein ABSF44_10595 [Candidatus Bathyarchaeia archaeon]|jgi:hypothetical protein
MVAEFGLSPSQAKMANSLSLVDNTMCPKAILLVKREFDNGSSWTNTRHFSTSILIDSSNNGIYHAFFLAHQSFFASDHK